MRRLTFLASCFALLPLTVTAASSEGTHLQYNVRSDWSMSQYGSSLMFEGELTGLPHPPSDYSTDGTLSIRCTKDSRRLGIGLHILKHDALFDKESGTDEKITFQIAG